MTHEVSERQTTRLLWTLERLLGIPATDLRTALNEASQLVMEALGCEKVDAFLHDASRDSLKAVGTSRSPMGQRQVMLGLDWLPIANGGSAVKVWLTGEPYQTGHAEQDPEEIRGIVTALGVRSTLCVALEVGGVRRGVLSTQSSKIDFFTHDDLRFLAVVSKWVGATIHRAELIEEIARSARASGRQAAAEELITVLAHDLRNHLTPLQGRVALLLGRAQRDGRQDDVRNAELALRAVNRFERLISDLLDVGRLDQGLFVLQPGPFDLVTLAHEVARTLGSGPCPVEVKGRPELVVTADTDRIRQALENLVGNAIKHSPEGRPVRIEIGEELEGPEKRALVDVVDQGPGVPPELLPRLFERFVTGMQGSGLGLGLYLAHRIALTHGGALAVSSTPGRGARFRLSLPVEDPPGARAAD